MPRILIAGDQAQLPGRPHSVRVRAGGGDDRAARAGGRRSAARRQRHRRISLIRSFEPKWVEARRGIQTWSKNACTAIPLCSEQALVCIKGLQVQP